MRSGEIDAPVVAPPPSAETTAARSVLALRDEDPLERARARRGRQRVQQALHQRVHRVVVVHVAAVDVGVGVLSLWLVPRTL